MSSAATTTQATQTEKQESSKSSWTMATNKSVSNEDTFCDLGLEDMPVANKVSLSQDGFRSATGPATSCCIIRSIDVMESHREEILREIEPLPTSNLGSLRNNGEVLRPAVFRRSKLDSDNMTCPDETPVSQCRPQSGPGAYAVHMVQISPPIFIQSSITAPAAIPDVDMADDKDAANPILHHSTNAISILGIMDDLELSTRPEPCLAEANPVIDEREDVTVVDACPVDLYEVQKRQLQWAMRKKMYGLSFFLLLIVLAVIVGSVVKTHATQSSEDVATQAPNADLSIEPSGAPSSAPSEALDLLFLDLPLHTQDSIFNGNTPQHQAWEWLSTHQNITYLPNWRKTQLFALATFFFAFEGEHWNPLIQERWMDDTKEECLWFSSGFGRFEGEEFVEWSLEVDGYPQVDSCNSQGEFIWLDLGDLHLSGFAPYVPREIALLTSLSYIGLYDNDIEVPFAAIIPSQLLLPTHSSGLTGSKLGGLTSLEVLTLSENYISGQLPSELGLLTEMTILYIDMNILSGFICTELGEMTSLVELTLHDNSFWGTIPSELGQLTNLEWLGLQHLPLLTGAIPSELTLLTSLRFLDLRNSTGLSGVIPDELCFLKNGSCTFVDWWGASYNCTLEFDCTDMLCGCDCPCSNNSLGVGTLIGI
jgi:hypothetical protein